MHFCSLLLAETPLVDLYATTTTSELTQDIDGHAHNNAHGIDTHTDGANVKTKSALYLSPSHFILIYGNFYFAFNDK